MKFFYLQAGRLPQWVLNVLAFLVYLGLYQLTGYRKAVVQQNLQIAFAEKNAKELTVLKKKYYRYLTNLLIELLRGLHWPQSEFRQRVQQVNPQLLRECTANFTCPLIILSIHQGNWEWMLHSTSAEIDVPTVPVFKPLHDKAANDFALRFRRRFGATPLPLNELWPVVRTLKAEPKCLVILADQSPVKTERTHWVDFFGRSTAFHAGPAHIAKISGAAVVFARCTKISPGNYSVEYELLANAGEVATPENLTAAYAQAAERAIRRQPEGWLWSNRRWKREIQRESP